MSNIDLSLQVDEDGFVCVVAPDTYRGFVDEDWALDDLLARFVEQMNRGSLFVAYPGPDNANSNLIVESESSPVQALREASGIVQVGAEGLWVTDYTQLSMAAQFADESPLAGYSQRLPAEPGMYRVTLREDAENDSTFLLTISLTSSDTVLEHLSVPWFD
ncbi:hypothetical protein [Rhodococcus oryzae]|uniref:hypothetical protein n=1 Tax=Rhodococcus oryzae TaxID=2571143 RepID=UPI00378BE685